MRPRLRLRTVLIAVALVSMPLAYAAVTFRHGGFHFQRYHDQRAHHYWEEASRADSDIWVYQHHDHGGPGNYCASCRLWTGLKDPTGRKAAAARRRWAEARRLARWHDFLAGPARDRPPRIGL